MARIYFIGGPADLTCKAMKTPPNDEIEVAEIPPLEWKAGDRFLFDVKIRRHLYRLFRLPRMATEVDLWAALYVGEVT